ncbi:MAG TPA: site-2 protease family protein [Kofleriaceae bacterium]|nr:site-2 protease family protein [Kofleriaceae bacterium]
MDFSPEQIRWIIQALIILILSICVHEFGHAIVADKLGDPLPRSQGRTTLNPASHADPIGTLLFPLVALIATKGGSLGFGWGRPVEVSPRHFSRRFTMRTGHLMVAAAGPLMNLLFGMFISLVHLTLWKTGVLPHDSQLHQPLLYAVQLNFVLMFFNLIPAPPLDGGAVLEGLLPARYLPAYHRYAVYGPFVLMGVILIPGAAMIVAVPARWLSEVWWNLIGMPV